MIENNHGKCDDNCLKFYDAICRQIEAENDLMDKRLSWMLKFNSFIFAAMAIAARITEESLQWFVTMKSFVSIILPTIGILVSFSGLIGCMGARRQLAYIVNDYKEKKKVCSCITKFPRPFGDEKAYKYGTCSAVCVPIFLIMGWVAYFIVLIIKDWLANN